MWCILYKVEEETRSALFHTTTDLLQFAQNKNLIAFSVEFIPVWEPEQPKSTEELEQARKRREVVMPTPLSRSKD